MSEMEREFDKARTALRELWGINQGRDEVWK